MILNFLILDSKYSTIYKFYFRKTHSNIRNPFKTPPPMVAIKTKSSSIRPNRNRKFLNLAKHKVLLARHYAKLRNLPNKVKFFTQTQTVRKSV